MSEHRYTDDEVHAIFERAAARQEEARRAEDASRAGLTLAELQRIGAEAGIDPAHVAAAAVEVGVGRPPAPAASRPILGMPTGLRYERHLPAPVTDAMWEQIVADLRRLFDTDGLGSAVGRVREWAVREGGSRHERAAKVTLTPEGEGTRVVIEQVLRGTSVGLLWGSSVYVVMAMIFGLFLAFGDFDPEASFLPGVFLLMAALFYGISAVAMRAYARRQAAKFEQALDRIERIVGDQASAAPVPAGAAPEAAPLDLDALPDPSEPERDVSSSWRTRS